MIGYVGMDTIQIKFKKLIMTLKLKDKYILTPFNIHIVYYSKKINQSVS